MARMAGSAKVLVTGASGFLAGHVVQQLQAAGHVVRGTVRSTKNQAKVKHLYNLCPGAKHPVELVEADLLNSETWLPAVQGMDYVIHTASPLPFNPPSHDDDLIQPAVQGTLAVLRACAKVHSVKRVVLTSSVAAVDFGRREAKCPKPASETDWADPAAKTLTAYARSKVLAEQSAWDFVNNLKGSDNKFELSVINPSLIVGPPLQMSSCTSVELISMILTSQLPRVPRLHLGLNDVRDCAAAHVKAMTLPNAAGKRHIINSQSLWLAEIAVLLKTVFQPQGYSIQTATLPTVLVWLASWFDKRSLHVYNELGMEHLYDNQRMREVLGIQPRNVRESIVEMACALIEADFVKKTPQYNGRGGEDEKQRYMQVPLS